MRAQDIVGLLREASLLKKSNVIQNVNIVGISDDSRKIARGFLFVAVQGLRTDGNKYLEDAIKSGASTIVSERPFKKAVVGERVNYIQVQDSRKALSLIAALWYENPAEKLKIIGLTGTKGKTTVAHLLHHIFNKVKIGVGMISTVNAVIANEVSDTGLHVTNPEPLLFQSFLKKMVDKGLKYAVCEITSHGLDQERVYGINYEVGVLTNITPEHLDYHKTFANYRRSKLKLFERSKKLVVNRDDPSYRVIRQMFKNDKKMASYSLNADADIVGKIHRMTEDYMDYGVVKDAKVYRGRIKLLGKYNLYNVLAAVCVAQLEGIGLKASMRALEDFQPPEGRLEKVNNELGINIYIDFAHTPDSLENLLLLLKKMTKKRLICVFGCAGERDKRKRFQMGKISGRLADLSIITAEDPRTEDVNGICSQIKRGALKALAKDYFSKDNAERKYLIVPDRYEAIYYSIKSVAQTGDTIVICGKGHENSMCYGKIEHLWKDRIAIENVLKAEYGKNAIILAAGKGKRLNSEAPKVILDIAEKPIVSYCVTNLRRSGFSNITLVVGYRASDVIKEIGPTVNYAFQRTALGTGHAAWQGMKNLKSERTILVVNGDDSAFYKPETFAAVFQSHLESKAKLTFTSTILENPTGIGRLVRDINGTLLRIVEEKIASESEKKIKECNIGMYVFDRGWFLKNIKKVKKGTVGEYYITDLIEIAVRQNDFINVFRLNDSRQWCGINTWDELEHANKKMNEEINKT